MNEKIDFLGMKASEISIDFQNEKEITAEGLGKARFVYRSAKETGYTNLCDIASGGEISRVMLAMKSLLSQKLNIDIIIFDEIDAGIGGNIAFAIGREMQNIVNNHKQLLVITHLPQIAKYADRHFAIEKNIDDKVLTSVKQLSTKNRISEISRMLGGTGTKTDWEYAQNFLLKR